ncbi:MAG TPA: hypothetical protein VD931_01030 [Baekduia sp.]|nr:hypothetical protein [Baekduia sp.]
MKHVALAALLLAAPALAQMPEPAPPPGPPPVPPAVKLPETVKAAPGALVKVRADTACKGLVWILPESVAPEQWDACDDGKRLNLVAPASGSVTVYCVAAVEKDKAFVAKCVIVVDGPPKPPPPSPTDPFAAELKALYAADATPDKAKHAKALAELYRLGVKAAADATIATGGQLGAVLQDAAASLLEESPDALKATRQRVGAELRARLGDPAAPLTPATRQAAADIYGRAAAALEDAAK